MRFTGRWSRVGLGLVVSPVLLAGTTGLVGFAAEGTALASPNTVYVSPSGSAAASDANCANAGYSSVQAAANAVPTGGVVYLCGTTPYAEQVIITKSLTLTGDRGASIAAPASAAGFGSTGLPSQFATDNLSVPQAIVVITGSAVTATLSGIGVNGPLPGNGGCAVNEFGVLVIGGATADLNGDSVTNIADQNPSLGGCQFGVGIQVGREYWPTADFSQYPAEDFVGHANISHTTVSGYQKNGVTVDGAGSTAEISTSSVSGAGETNQIAQNGIQISRGAVASVHNNSVSGNQYTGYGVASSAGILIFGGCGDGLSVGDQIHNNSVTSNDIGVYSANYSPDCSTYASSATNESIHNNQITDGVISNVSGNGSQGYQAGILDIGTGDSIHNNDISGVGYTPAQTSPTAPCYVIPIDLSLANQPDVHNNNVH